jgi:hemerythrin
MVAIVNSLHTAAEDELMKEHNYPGYAEHRHVHHALLKHLENIVANISGKKFRPFAQNIMLPQTGFLYIL